MTNDIQNKEGITVTGHFMWSILLVPGRTHFCFLKCLNSV